MPAIDQTRVKTFVDAAATATTTTHQGKALEDLICYVFGLVPGIVNTARNKLNVFHTEEIDVAFFNKVEASQLSFLPNIILVECKQWSSKVTSNEVNWFDSKIKHRGLDFGILVAVHGVTGNQPELTSAHHIVSLALLEKRRLIVITVAELCSLADTEALADLIRQKLCELHLYGTVS
jgi:hypothetical protein